MKTLKLFLPSIIVLGFLLFILRPLFNIGCTPSLPTADIPDTWSKPLSDAGYHPANHHKPENVPEDKQPPAGEVILHGSGTVENSVETVELIGVQTPDGKKWLAGWVGDRRIIFDRLDWQQLEVANCDHSDFRLVACCAWVGDRPDMGLGLAWQPVTILGADIGPEVSFDLNEHITQSPDWFAVSGRLSRSYGPFETGIGIGYRIGEDSGLHLEGNFGLRIGI